MSLPAENACDDTHNRLIISRLKGVRMKYTIEHISQGENEVILRCHGPSAEMEQLIRFLEYQNRKLIGNKDGIRTILEPSQIL